MAMFDIVILGILLIGALKGFRKGLVIELISLVALVLGIYGAILFSGNMGEFLYDKFGWNTRSIYGISIPFAIVFIGIVLGLHILGKALTKLLDLVALGIANKLLGALFGVLKYLVIISVLIYFYDKLSRGFNTLESSSLEGSVFYSILTFVGDFLCSRVTEYIK